MIDSLLYWNYLLTQINMCWARSKSWKLVHDATQKKRQCFFYSFCCCFVCVCVPMYIVMCLVTFVLFSFFLLLLLLLLLSSDISCFAVKADTHRPCPIRSDTTRYLVHLPDHVVNATVCCHCVVLSFFALLLAVRCHVVGQCSSCWAVNITIAPINCTYRLI